MASFLALCSSLLILIEQICGDEIAIAGNGFEYHCFGNCKQTDEHIHRNPTPAVILLGGGTDIHEDAVRTLVDYSDGGNVLILETKNGELDTASSNYVSYIHSLNDSHSVASVLIDSTKLKEERNYKWIVDQIQKADGLFIFGEPCSQPLSSQCRVLYDAIEDTVRDRRIPIVGTVYQRDGNLSMDSNTALIDPYDERMRLDDGLQLSQWTAKSVLTPETIIDAQFRAHDRCGLLIAWMARLRAEGNGDAVRGIGIGLTASIVVDLDTNIGTVMGNDSVYVLTADHDPSVCEPAVPLTFHNVNVQKLAADDEYDFDSWSGGREALQYTVSAVNGELSPWNPYLNGHLSSEQVRREKVHRLVMWILLLCCMVMVGSASMFWRNQLLERQLKESQRQANEEDYHPLL